MNGVMLREMRDQGSVLEASLGNFRQQLANLRLPGLNEVILTGSGDSLFAAMAVRALFEKQLDVPVYALSSMTTSRFRRISGRTLVVPISVSGEVIRTREAALRSSDAGGRVLAVVANGDSRLAQESDGALIMPPPITRQTPHTRDYTLTLLALGVLCEALSGKRFDELDRWPRVVEETVGRSLRWAESLLPVSRDVPVWFLGAGPDHATAAYGALKFWEAGGSPAWYDDLEEFGHGPQLIARPGDVMVLIAPDPAASRALELVPGMARLGLRTILLASEASLGAHPGVDIASYALPSLGDWRWSPFVSCIPVQALTYAVTTSRGIDTMLPLGGAPLGATMDEVHNEWMRESRLKVDTPVLEG